MLHWVEDIRHGIRTVLRNPRFSVLACLLLTVGIGLNTTVFSVVNAVLLRPLPFRDSDRLVLVGAKRTESNVSYPISPAEFWDWKQQNSVFEDIAAFASAHPALLVRDEAMMVRRTVATASLFSMLGVQPLWGRTFRGDEEARGDQVAILTHDFWSRAFGANPNVVGTPVALDGGSFTIVGVLPAGFNFFTNTDVWTLVNLPRQARDRRAVGVIAKLRHGVPIEQARAEMDGIARSMERSYPNTNRGFTGTVITPLRERFVYKVHQSLEILWAAVGVLLLIVCGNIASLQMARSEARHKEIAIRASVGADQLRIIRQLVAESAVIALVGGFLGILFSIWGVHLITRIYMDLPRLTEIHIDGTTLVACFSVSAVAALLCSIVPAIRTNRVDLGSVLKESGRSTAAAWGFRGLLGFLVIAQTALTLILVSSGSLLVKSYINIQQINPGFRLENLATVGLKLPMERYSEPFAQAPILASLMEHIKAIPGVEAVGATNSLPIVGQAHNVSFAIRGLMVPSTSTVQYRFVTPDYFHTMGISIQKGRVFSDRDNRSGQPVCVINATMAKRYWPNADPVGASVQLPDRLIPGAPWMQVVGVVGDVRQMQLIAEPAPEVSLPIFQFPNVSEMTFVIRSRTRTAGLSADVKSAIRSVDNGLPPSSLEWMGDLLSRTVVANRYSAEVLGAFAVVALFVAATGMYGVISFAVSLRTRDMAVRLALGATPADLIGLVVRQGAKLASFGMVIGLLGTFALDRVVSSLLYEVTPLNPGILVADILLVAAVVGLACYVPARRASRIDPMSALRCE